jgi:hypothetical protein
MRAKIFQASGNGIDSLDAEINEWLKTLSSGATIRQISTAATEHKYDDPLIGIETTLFVTVFFDL